MPAQSVPIPNMELVLTTQVHLVVHATSGSTNCEIAITVIKVTKFTQRQYSVQDSNLRRICGWLVHVLAEKISSEVLFKSAKSFTVSNFSWKTVADLGCSKRKLPTAECCSAARNSQRVSSRQMEHARRLVQLQKGSIAYSMFVIKAQ